MSYAPPTQGFSDVRSVNVGPKMSETYILSWYCAFIGDSILSNISNNINKGTSSGSYGVNGAKRPQSKKPKVKTKESTRRQSMLNTHKLAPFKYDMNEILSSTSMDSSKASAFLASVIAKASRVSTRDAKDYIRGFLESGDITKEENDRICRLLDKYSKYR